MNSARRQRLYVTDASDLYPLQEAFEHPRKPNTLPPAIPTPLDPLIEPRLLCPIHHVDLVRRHPRSADGTLRQCRGAWFCRDHAENGCTYQARDDRAFHQVRGMMFRLWHDQRRACGIEQATRG